MTCNHPPRKGKKSCAECAAKIRARSLVAYRRRKAERICQLCSGPLPQRSVVFCPPCRYKRKASSSTWYKKRIAAGMCVNCKDKAMDGAKMCEHCHWRNLSKDHFGHSGMAGTLRGIFESSRRCYLCGVDIAPGVNAALDHVKPTCRWPDLHAEQSNLRFSCRRCNVSKHKMTPEEFLAMCREVLEHNGVWV